MSKADDLLAYFKKHVGEWACSMCGSHSVQPAATFRTLKDDGWQFEEVSPQRWGKQMPCAVCGQMTTHYKLTSLEQGVGNSRNNLTPAQRNRIIGILGRTDAFTGASAVSSAEVDHKEPLRRLREKGLPDPNPDLMTDWQIRENYQILTRDHNLLKDRMCEQCQREVIRPPFNQIAWWYEGDEHYCGTCKGCAWYDGAEWCRRFNEWLISLLNGSVGDRPQKAGAETPNEQKKRWDKTI